VSYSSNVYKLEIRWFGDEQWPWVSLTLPVTVNNLLLAFKERITENCQVKTTWRASNTYDC